MTIPVVQVDRSLEYLSVEVQSLHIYREEHSYAQQQGDSTVLRIQKGNFLDTRLVRLSFPSGIGNFVRVSGSPSSETSLRALLRDLVKSLVVIASES